MKNNTPYFINTDKNFQVLDHNLFIVKEFTNTTKYKVKPIGYSSHSAAFLIKI